MTIKKLPQEVASKIAAGEVVERPVSVVKELVENAIDAQATEITISVQEAGRKLIEVVDNGIGIPRDEMGIAIQRYATSKISAAEDLNCIKTLGFRGEALASISAVSRLAIESRIPESKVGFANQIEGGQLINHKEIGKPIGTKICVHDLFFNVPARLKFLKSDRTERRRINQVISRYALFYDAVRFALSHDGRVILTTSGNGKRREILSQIYDTEIAKQLLPIQYADDYMRINGFTSPYNLTRSSRGDIFFFINGRLVSDPAIVSAITRAYQGLMMVGRFPISILFIDLQPDEIDVNVHPTKTEIRIKDSSRVFSTVHRTIRKTISAYSPVPAVPPAIWSSFDKQEEKSTESLPESLLENSSLQTGDEPGTLSPGPDGGKRSATLPLLRLIGQIGQTYLVAEGPDGLYLIDQHAAHERILFERLHSSVNKGNTQLLLEPCVVSVNEFQAEDMEEKISIAKELGFQIEDFGPGAFKITGIPQILGQYEPQFAFMSLVAEDAAESNNAVEIEKKELLVKRICKRLAIKGGQKMSVPEQAQLIRDLEYCDNPRTCPHGRPTIIHISVNTLERRFGRIGSI